ncbi:MAG: tetratricopeptide repeat protein, partial [Ignavibacteriaceae bacterium]
KTISPLKEVELLRKMGVIYVNIGELENAASVLSSSEEKVKKLSDLALDNINKSELNKKTTSNSLGKILITKALVEKFHGNYKDAKQNIEKGLELLGSEGNFKDVSQAYNNLGNILYDQGEYFQAAEMYQKSLELREKISDKKGIAEAYNNLSNVYYEQGNYQKSAEMMEKSLNIMIEIGFKIGIAGSYNNLGSIYQDLGKYKEAFEMHKKSLTIREEIGDMPGVAVSKANLGYISLDLHKYNEANEYLVKCINLMEEMELKFYESHTRVWLSQSLAELGQYTQAKNTALKALQVAEELNQKSAQAFAKRMLATIEMIQLERSGQVNDELIIWERIERQLNEALQIFNELKMEHEIGRSYFELAKYFKQKGDLKGSQKFINESKKIFESLGALGDLEKIEKLSGNI